MKIFKYIDHLSTFVAVAQAGSFSAVANNTGSNPSSIMRKIDILEDVVGGQIFVRSARGVVLTDVGKRLFDRSIGVLNELDDIHKEIVSSNKNLEGSLRISCLPTFAKIYILPYLNQFKQLYPKIDVVLDLTERLLNPSLERLDVALRIGKLTENQFYASHIGVQKWWICASPNYLKEYGTPSNLNDLIHHDLIDKYKDNHSICWRRILSAEQIKSSRFYLKVNDFEALKQSAIAGCGIVFLPNWVVADAISTHQLTLLFEDPEQREDDIYFVRALSQVSPNLKVFIDFLKDKLSNSEI